MRRCFFFSVSVFISRFFSAEASVSPLFQLWLWGIFGGIPFLLTGSTLSLWLKDEGVSLVALGWISLLHLPYGLKFLWAPFFDFFSLPWFGKVLGKRGGWIFICQFFAVLGIFWVSWSAVSVGSIPFWLGCLWIAIWATTHDLLMQASQMDTLPRQSWGYGEAAAIFGYRLGFLAAGAGALYLSSFLPWKNVWRCLGVLCCVSMALTLAISAVRENSRIQYAFSPSFREPFRVFFTNPVWKWVLSFMVFYRLQDSLLSFFPQFFYLEIGFSKTQLAVGYKAFGILAAALGGFIGAYWVRTKGYLFSLKTGLILHMLSNIGFFLQIVFGNALGLLYATVAIEEITKGISITAFFAYQLLCCRGAYVVSQLALLTGVTTLAQACVGSFSGVLVASLGWPGFFFLTAVGGLPALILLHFHKIPHVEKNRSTKDF